MVTSAKCCIIPPSARPTLFPSTKNTTALYNNTVAGVYNKTRKLYHGNHDDANGSQQQAGQEHGKDQKNRRKENEAGDKKRKILCEVEPTAWAQRTVSRNKACHLSSTMTLTFDLDDARAFSASTRSQAMTCSTDSPVSWDA